MDFISRHFLGRPYVVNPLVGSAETPELFVASLDGFDCVTYIETVLALARASSFDAFVRNLRQIRYQDGRVEWRYRNHYMTGWIRNNIRGGVVETVRAPAARAISRERVLDVLPGLPPRRIRVKCIPKNMLPSLRPRLQGGDLVFFASTRRTLDVFHTGIIACDDGEVVLRHASRSQGGVVEQKLDDFLKANRMAGLIVVRPREKKQRHVAHQVI